MLVTRFATNGAPGIATRNKDATNGAPGIATRNKKLLGEEPLDSITDEALLVDSILTPVGWME